MSRGFLRLATLGVQNLNPYQPGRSLEVMQREYGIKRVTKLASNENPLGASMHAIEAAQNACQQMHYYPDGAGSKLREALAVKYSGYGISPDQITLGSGSSELLELIARAFVTVENEVVFSQHAFAMYSIIAQAIGAKAVVTSAREWGHDLDAMAAAVNARTRIIFISNPNNPTGTYCKQGEVHHFLRHVPKDIIVVIDEAYAEYAEEDDYPDSLSWLSEHPNLVVARTFSKIYGLAGLRVGYTISHLDIAAILHRIRQPFNVNHIAMEAAVAALQDEAHVIKSRRINREGRQYLQDECSKLGLGFIPSIANFLSINIGPRSLDICDELMRQGVVVRPLAEYSMPHYLRVTIGLQEENERFISALRHILEIDAV